MKNLSRNLTFQVLTAILLGVLLGAFFPEAGAAMRPLGETFINLIKMVIVPIIFLTVVLGIGSIGNMKKVGRVGGKALLYFELITTFALIIGVVVANLVKPGLGVDTRGTSAGAVDTAKYASQAAEMDWVAFFTHIVRSLCQRRHSAGAVLFGTLRAGAYEVGSLW
jgi:aerobic C4-dicarboxylate transport protein